MSPAEGEILLQGYPWRPAFHASTAPFLDAPPGGIVIHSGELGEGTAEYAWTRAAKYYAHLAWSKGLGAYVQTAGLGRRAPHAGRYNCWLGIEMPGPAHAKERPQAVRDATVQLVRALIVACPSIRAITGHQWVDRRKRDPGPGVGAEWWNGLGLEVWWGRHVGMEPLRAEI